MSSDAYQRAAKSLVRETKMSEAQVARIEQRLLDAMQSRVSQTPLVRGPSSASATDRPAPPPKTWATRWAAISIAAGLTLIVGTILVWRLHQPASAPKQLVERSSVPEPTKPASTSKPAVTPVVTPSPTKKGHVRPAGGSRPAAVATHEEFIELPWTAGLPAFESGEIVRMELPAATLPNYGIDISPAAGSRPIEADVLVGQDGLARAIRLVTSSARSTQ